MLVEFENDKGEVVYIPEEFTLEQMIGGGVRGIDLVKEGSGIGEGWYRATGRCISPVEGSHK